MSKLAAFLSFRFSATDGVSVVARSWMKAFNELGFTTVTVSGETGSDRVVNGIGLTPTQRDPAAITADLEKALADADVIVVENLLTIPMNMAASDAAETVLRGRRALLHHHDPPWQRSRYAHITTLPRDSRGWIHVAINRVLQSELAERGIESTLIYNGFDVPDESTLADRADVRSRVRRDLGVEDSEILIVHPVRAIERKNIPVAISLCEQLGATYWLTGPAEEDYTDTLKSLLRRAECRVIHQPAPSRFEMYAAADHVTFPSTWEGFGNPPIEASLHRRTVSIGSYPVASELLALGFDWADATDVTGVKALLDTQHPAKIDQLLDRNRAVATEHFSSERMTDALQGLLSDTGWLP